MEVEAQGQRMENAEEMVEVVQVYLEYLRGIQAR
jgi:hypothetical protein